MQELVYLKVACLNHIWYHGVLLRNEIVVEWLNVAMCFSTYSCLGVRMWTRGLVRPLFVLRTTWFYIAHFCNADEDWVGHAVKDQEVCDSKDV